MSITSFAEPVDQVVTHDQPNAVRRGRVWKAPSIPDARGSSARSRGSSVIGLAVAGALVLAGSVVAGLDDGPQASIVDGSMTRVVEQIGAREAWAAGATGDGVTVAIIDTGVAPVAALDGQVVAAVDLSSEQRDPSVAFSDSFGHGTHMAGIIAGRAPGVDILADSADFVGVAPDAQIASVKVAGRDGMVTREEMIAGIDWAVAHAEELDVKVLTLAFDAPAAGSYVNDPLAHALERAWDAGIVVVTAAGNDGASSDGLAAPAYDPYVIAVAGVDGSGDAMHVPNWANRGDGTRNPDLAAPGAHIESLRAPGSDADVNHSSGRVDDERFLASGSSQAAAVVAGAIAVLLDARPELTPDQVKQVLIDTAVDLSAPADRVGHGLIDIAAALGAPVGEVTQTFEPATASDPASVSGVMMLDLDEAGSSWASGSWASGSWASGSWASGSWASGSWASGSWASGSWASGSWASGSWA